MSKARTTTTTTTTTTRARATKAKGCVMPACKSTRVRGKVYCSTHAPVARERIRIAAGEAAWA